MRAEIVHVNDPLRVFWKIATVRFSRKRYVLFLFSNQVKLQFFD